MKNIFGLTALAFLLMPCSSALADLGESRFALYEETITVAGELDAYDTYCETEKESSLNTKVLLGAENETGSEAQLKSLRKTAKSAHDLKLERLELSSLPCNDIDFMFEKYSLFQKMNDLTARLLAERGKDL